MIGTRELAQAAERLHYSGEGHLAGFERIGAGCSRDAYLGPDGVVYKVGDDDANRDEWDNFTYLRDNLPEGWGVAACTLHYLDEHTSVIAMEYIAGEEIDDHYSVDPCNETCKGWGQCVCDAYSDLTRATGLYDVHAGNFRVLDGIRVLIDYAA